MLDGMMQRTPQTHPPRPLFLPLPPSLIDLVLSQPPSPQRTTESTVVVKRGPEQVVLAPSKWTFPDLFGMIENVIHVLDVPIAVEIDGVGCVDCFQTVVETYGRGPHFGKHGVFHLPGFLVHEIDEALRESGDGDDGGSAGRFFFLHVVACDVVSEDPIRFGWVKVRVEDYEVCVFTYPPFVVVRVI